MNKKSIAGHSHDRSNIAGGQDYGVSYEKEKMNVSGKQVKDAVKPGGNSRKKVEQKLRRPLL